MADRSFFVSIPRLTLAAAASLLAVACGGSAPAPSPEAAPVTTFAPAPTLPPETVPTLPPMGGGAPAGFPPPVAAPSAEAPAASPAGPPSPAADDEARKQREDQLRADVAAAKGRADTLAAQVASECPELKPGEMRHPGAVGRCNQLKAEANQAASQYETLKQQARSVGITVQ